ncbi:hypothetical protein P171DRAFT_214228 [Karstenula rhodostoma CBS 690.94]|uniref:Uncharacterized protein n=1 Tax=Karstenula rhodostoma CBS 690.94 TaxID=1392251 RepID=A0A9P4UGH0_9PLEO|nr:hypothetical protein P171DRAFT_214228 [Karstenula rhodostoma CBS 690.94]
MSFTRRRSSLEAPLSPSTIPDFALLGKPLPNTAIPVGQLVSRSSKHDPSMLEHRDYDDIGTKWYKDVIIFNSESGRFLQSLGGAYIVKTQLEEGVEVGTIEAESQHVRLLKDANAALNKALQDDKAKAWLKENKEAGFVVATREVLNASYKRARLVATGAGNYEVRREVGHEGQGGKRRDSGLDVQTNSNTDIVGVVVREIVENNGEYSLGEELEASFWE